MNPSSVRAKGQNYERELAKDIETHLGGRANRSPNSGALWWNKADINCWGNIMTRFHIEAKRQEKCSWNTWYAQALRGGRPSKIPIVVSRKSHDVSMVYMKWIDFLEIVGLWQKCEEENNR